jgi:pyruvate ferredoxin oxidoreductase gamma subunit
MKTAGRILGTAFFLEGYEVQDAPRYGAERRGAPIFAYVRASREIINERGVIGRPDLIVVADETLIQIPAAGVLAGAIEKTVMIIGTTESPGVWRKRLNFAGPLIVLAPPQETEDRLEIRSMGSACAGAAARLVGVISRVSLLEAISSELAGLGAAIVLRNREAALAGYESMAAHEGLVTEADELPPAACQTPQWVDLPFDDARTSAPVIHASSTTPLVKTGLWRTMRPVIDPTHCKGCWWVCSTFCPDSAITVAEDGYPRVDYDHCKGCMICVTQCTSHAIRAVPEHEAERAPNQGGVS